MLWVVTAGMVIYFLYRYLEQRDKAARDKVNISKARITDQGKFVTRLYKGSQAEATALFQIERARMEGMGYSSKSQNWVPGEWGAGNFLVALLLCIV